MNGAIAEPLVSTIRPPKITIMIRIGNSQNFLRSRMNAACPACGFRFEGAGGQRFQAHFEFGQIERFGEVVIGTAAERADLVVELRARSEHQYRHLAAGIAQAREHFASVHARQHPVEHDRVVVLGERKVQADGTVGRGVESVAACFEVFEQIRDQVPVVFHQQQAHAHSQTMSIRQIRSADVVAPSERDGR